MGNCLVTKLKSTVNNPALLTLNEFRVNYNGNSESGANVINLYWEPTTTGVCSVRVIGSTFDGGGDYFECNKGEDVSITVTSGVPCTIVIGNKQDLRVLDFSILSGMNIDLAEVKYLGNLVRGQYWMANGSVSEFNTLLGNNKFNTCLFVGTSNFKGDITQITASTEFNRVIFENTGVYGDFPTFINGLTNITEPMVSVTESSLTGDLSAITNDLVLCFIDYNIEASWEWKNTRNSERKIIALNGSINFGNDLDAMLINQADCQIGYTQYASDSRYKLIDVRGNKTSASDAAVATLKSKGYTVIVNGETL